MHIHSQSVSVAVSIVCLLLSCLCLTSCTLSDHCADSLLPGLSLFVTVNLCTFQSPHCVCLLSRLCLTPVSHKGEIYLFRVESQKSVGDISARSVEHLVEAFRKQGGLITHTHSATHTSSQRTAHLTRLTSHSHGSPQTYTAHFTSTHSSSLSHRHSSYCRR